MESQTKFRRTLASAAAALAVFAVGTSVATAEELTGTWMTAVTYSNPAQLAGNTGPLKILSQRYGVTRDEAGAFVAFYSDVISVTYAADRATWETHGTYHFSEQDKFFYHTVGYADLATGEWFWDVREITGGEGIFATITTGVGLTGQVTTADTPNDLFGPGGGCANPPNDPEGFPAIVICNAPANITY